MSNLILKNSTFIHIPKCAGTFIQSVLSRMKLVKTRMNDPQYGHLFIHQMPDIRDKYNFAFVRHPYTWWPSFHNWCKKDRFSKVERQVNDFDVWLKDYGPFWMGQYTRLVQRYIGEDPLYSTKNGIHFIGKTENVHEDLKTALKNGGDYTSDDDYNKAVFSIKNAEDVEFNQNIAIYDRSPISEESKRIIYDSEKYIFERFDYSKDI